MIHSSVVIEDGAKIADDVTIGPFCYISKDVEIENGCQLEANVVLKGKLKVGSGVRIFSFTTVGNDDTDITIGENTHIREFAQIGSQDDNIESKNIKIGASNFIMGYVQILGGVELGDMCIISNASILNENVKCEERVIVSAMTTVEPNNTLGTGVMVGGASYVDHDMPPFTLVEGNHASVKGINIVGLRRRLENKSDIEDIKLIFKRILRDTSEGIDKELAHEIAQTHDNEYVKRFSTFVANSNMQ